MLGGLGLVLVLSIGGCASPRYRTVALDSTVSTMLTEADTRLISLRPNPKGADKPKILCAEPSPDVAKALSLAMRAESKVATPGGTSVGVGAGYASSEALMTLAGRTTTVVALRDGLYRACEAYANGIIGRSAYAMILSQYGDLLVTLTLGEAAAGATVPNGTTVQATNPTISIDSTAPPAVKKEDEADDTPNSDAPAEGTKKKTTASAPTPGVREEGPAPAPSQPTLMPAALLMAAEPAAAKPTAPVATSEETKIKPPEKPPLGDAAAVAQIADLYWENIHARAKRSTFATCVSVAETSPEGDSQLQANLRDMCRNIFATAAREAALLPNAE